MTPNFTGPEAVEKFVHVTDCFIFYLELYKLFKSNSFATACVVCYLYHFENKFCKERIQFSIKFRVNSLFALEN